MPGHFENVVVLNADHSGVCKFGDSFEDHDNFKLVQSNIKDLYEKALKTGQQLKRHQTIRQLQNVILRDDHDAAYTQLKPNEVRFLVLRSGSDTKKSIKTAIEVEFHVESTDTEKTEAYEALSYVWGGSPLDSAYNVRVWIRYLTYVELPITWNLYCALLALRGPKNRRLWADALCINQRNDVERSEQVAKMGWIYQHAANVPIFLGGESPRNTGADEYINRMLKFAVGKRSDSKREKEQLLSVSALLTRRWFSRRWVVQEVALARKATVIIPGFTSVAVYNWEMPWVDFADAITLFSRRRAEVVERLTPDDAFGFGEIHALGAASLVDITNNLHRKDSEGRILERLLDLESLLAKIPMFEVTQIHDAVYAVLGLAKDTQSRLSDSKPPIHIDYHTSHAVLFASVVRFIIAQSNSLNILCRPWAPSSSELPSWIATVVTYPYARRPDGQYHRQYADTLVGSPNAKGKVYSASRKFYRQSEAHSITDRNFERLIVTGVEFDQILSVGDKAINGNTPASWIIMAGWGDVNDECPADFWRTVVADRGPDGEKAPSWYRRACEHVYHRIGNVDLDTSKMITTSLSDDADFLRRMQSIIWGRRFFKTQRGQPGLGPPDCKKGDIVAILWGCSVPVILRRVAEDQSYKLVGECYLQGCMDGDIAATVEDTRIFTLI
ncbi:HET-domain-containing protein [Hyaloscypha variabilis F]|uniref:HET-domain-containing protein n=1 Tax=Hyaloscypha variabilis (strain UAMH 11265 / GT02V1 / F) TaxID=1149755 RepID=A0A2J6QVI7_HYAVF|nr:HET-domain-containing protein [Hyaloscypha variabilis F]